MNMLYVLILLAVMLIAIGVALLDGFIFGAIFAWLYNKISG